MGVRRLACAAAVAALTAGCAEPPVKPIAEAQRRGVVAVSGDVSGLKQSDTSKLGARGTNEGARLGAEDGASRIPPAGPIGIVAKIAGAAVGGVKGASEAQTEEVVDDTRASLRRAIDEADFTELLRTRLAASKAGGDIQIVGMTADGTPASPPAKPASHVIAVDYRLAIQREYLVNPKVGVLVEATAQVRDPAGGQPVHQATWSYCGERDHFVKMAANNAAALRAQIDQAATVLAEAIPYDLYVSKQPRPLQTAKPACMDFSDLPSGIGRKAAQS
jgi:hypothetical protein